MSNFNLARVIAWVSRYSHRVTVTVTKIMLMGKMGMQPILPVTVPIKKIKGVTNQCYGDGDGDGVVRCEQTCLLQVCV